MSSALAPGLPAESISFPIVLFRGMTAEEYAELPESEQRLELINGDVLMAAKPRIDHQVFLGELYAALREWVRANDLGLLLLDVEVRLNDEWAPAPDLIWLKKANLGRLTENRVVGPTDLAVEILSPSTRDLDRGDKFETYAQEGIDWYWIVDVEAATLDEYQRVDQAYFNHIQVPFATTFKPRTFPGLSIDLASLRR